MQMQSARTLWIFALILAVVGSMVPSPSGSFFFSVAATLMALLPALFGTGRARLAGAIVCVLSLALAVGGFSAMQKDQAAYTERAKSKNRATGAPAPSQRREMPPSSSEK